ncbi:MAG: dNTP triphosphohydrolase [Gammaproteobacteria bacterium]|nr:dNTP triphosphohydrolase [Gammaproteobacteria bacterium]
MRPLYGAGDVAREWPAPDLCTYRSDFRRDYARLLHCPAFRRLQGKTQLFPGAESDFFRNRLTHSLEVAQIGKSIAMRVNSAYAYFRKHPIDLDLIETAALAHDLGHPPFGHNGESALDDCMRRQGGFEGNAQTLRILARLEKKEIEPECRVGLDLTYRTLAAVLKYDKRIPLRRRKPALIKGYYRSEADLVTRIKEHVAGTAKPSELPPQGFKTIECQIMDLADDIAYSTYDLEDALKGGFVTPMSMIRAVGDDDTLDAVRRRTGLSDDQIRTVVTGLWASQLENGGQPDDDDEDRPLDTAAHIDTIFHNLAVEGTARTAFTSQMVNACVNAIAVEVDDRFPSLSRVVLRGALRDRVEVVKILTYLLVVNSPNLKSAEYRGHQIVKAIFEALAAPNGDLLLPKDYQRQLRDEPDPRERTICDFIAAMTDRYALEFFGRLYSEGPQTIFKPL